MITTYKDIKALFEDFSESVDTRKVNNRSNSVVPSHILDSIEEGITSEGLDIILKDYPVFKYRTQITIHGQFNELCRDRIGGYKMLVQNKNKTIGVKYRAIDWQKKNLIYNLIKFNGDGWKIQENSTDYVLYRVAPYNESTIEQWRAFQVAIKNGCAYIGGFFLYAGWLYGAKYLIQEFRVDAIYKVDLPNLVERFTGKDYEELHAQYVEHLAARARENREYNDRLKKQLALSKKKEKEFIKAVERGEVSELIGFEYRKPEIGDIYATIEYRASDDKVVINHFYSLTKWGSKAKISRVDINGERVGGSFLADDKSKDKYLCRPLNGDATPKKEIKKVEKKESPAVKATVTIAEYSEKAIVVRGDTKQCYSILEKHGGKYNSHLKGGAGVIFSKKREDELRQALMRNKINVN